MNEYCWSCGRGRYYGACKAAPTCTSRTYNPANPPYTDNVGIPGYLPGKPGLLYKTIRVYE